jgi:hypothetical protein
MEFTVPRIGARAESLGDRQDATTLQSQSPFLETERFKGFYFQPQRFGASLRGKLKEQTP